MFMMAESIGGGRARQENDIGCLKANVVTGLEMVLVAVTNTTRNPALMHPLHWSFNRFNNDAGHYAITPLYLLRIPCVIRSTDFYTYTIHCDLQAGT